MTSATRQRPGPEVAHRPAESARPGPDLLRTRAVRGLLHGRWYPAILQIPAAAVFGLVAYELLAGPSAARDNAGTALLWILWWPALPLVFVLLGRFWCAVCPLGLLSDWIQRLVGVNRPVPRFLKRYGSWLIDAQFLAITWADHVWGIVESPWGSGVLLLLLSAGVIASGAFFARRAFCRYLCFLGGLAGNYARTSVVALRANPRTCATCTDRAACFHGTARVPGCPMANFPRAMASNASCTLCANCVTSCPDDALTLWLRPPTAELWTIRRPRIEASFLAMAIMGVVLIQNVTMLPVWDTVLDFVRDQTGITDPTVVFTAAFAVAVAAPVLALALVAGVAATRNGESPRRNFARFGYALIPLDLAGHLAHNLFHLLAEGRSIGYTIARLFGTTGHPTSTALVGAGTIRILQYALLALGTVASLYTAYRLAGRQHSGAGGRVQVVSGQLSTATLVRVAVLILALALLNTWLFAQPMAMRM